MKNKSNSKTTVNADQKIIKPNPYLETQKPHKKWYASNIMGKQRGKPRYDMAGKKVKKGK